MSSSLKQTRLPVHAYLRDEVVHRYARLTEEGLYSLAPQELFWQARYNFLKERGYLLRPRYSPGWKPSWIGTNLDPTFCEDSIRLLHYQVMDATRTSNGELLAIKSFYKEEQEMDIAKFFSSMQDLMNHCVPIHEILPDPYDPELALMVMPYLRPCNDPEFATVGDVIEFGLFFMHKHKVAHRDVAVDNIMMDAKPLYPSGHHPVQIGYTLDTLYPVSPLPRAGRKIQYYYIDFGLSMRFAPGASTLVVGDVGRDADVPELSDTVPYDAFKVDIFALGNLYLKEFEQVRLRFLVHLAALWRLTTLQKYKNVEFLRSLIEPMVRRQPEQRPTAEQALQEWTKTRETLADSLFRWRLVPKAEPAIERVVNDTVAVAWEGIYHLKKLVG
ncbi:hypothetical protein BN946_scf184993.g21 [Trametes cinnabarina]|uniref:Protein kinase domain-containing protein n=1 Tax=Pycnoporus cinnabarinus TaxID=5643 RepID=A0A060SYY4_PYCCI|nr:hypothetical protein BN946_scf184993.g21 [Trametes cinnabarina]